MSLRFVIVAVIVGCSAIPAGAQQFDRRARDEPEVVVAAGGRVGTCDVLRFTPLGDHLLAAGDDKVVWVWPHTKDGLDTDPRNTRTLHWRSWRDQLGGIKALAVSPDGKRVVIGGYGLRISSVAILDRVSGDTLAITWPETYEGGPNFDAVKAVAFDATGEKIAFGTADGSLWLWEPKKLVPAENGRTWNAPVRAGQFEIDEELLKAEKAKPAFNFPRSLHFTAANTLIGVSEFGQVLECDLAAKMTDDPKAAPPVGKTLFNVNPAIEGRHHIKCAEWTADGKWLAVATTGNLAFLRSADGKRTVPIRLDEDEFIRSIAIDATGKRLALGVGRALKGADPRFFMEDNDRILLYEDPTAEDLPKPRAIAHAGRAEALAFHPQLDRLAVAGGDADEVALIDLANAEKPLAVARGRGRHLQEVNLSEDGNVFGVRLDQRAESLDPNSRAEGDWTRFNLARFTPTSANVKWVAPVEKPGGWSVVPDTKSRYVWFAERKRADGSTERIRLGLDQYLDLAPTCYRFVPTEEGKPSRLLVGHYYGCSLFELDSGGVKENPRTGVMELPRSKLFIGHGAEVNSIAVDRLGTWFVTSANDQTVAAWSLADWKGHAALGAAFEVKNGQLEVSQVDVGSPAWEAGLSKGDVINGLAVDGKRIFNRQQRGEQVGSPEETAKALENPRSGIELFFAWTAGKSQRATPTRIKQRPLWKWFPAFDDRGRMTDSVLWMWHGSYYFTASMHGDRMVGWHVNHPDVSGTAQFHSLERYKHLFLKPGVIGKLIGTRSVEEALKEAGGGNVLRRSFREFEPEPVELALAQAEVRGDAVRIDLAVNALGTNPDLLLDRVELWLNDHRLKVWDGKGKNVLKEQVLIPASAFRAGDNQLTLLATNPAPQAGAEAVGHIRNPLSAANPQLLGVSVGVNDYSAHRKADLVGVRSFGDLVRASDDAIAFQKAVLGYRGAGKHFPKGDLALMLDATVDRKTLVASFADLEQKQAAGAVKSDDLLIVFFAGHGDLLSDAGKALPVKADGRGFAADSGRFVLCCPNYSPAKADATTLSGEELFEHLARLNCRKLVLIDACHAGGALETNLLRRCIPNNQGPVVIAACDESEKSFEDDKLRHGMFTYAVLEALGPRFRTANRALDGKLTAKELFTYVSERVPELMKLYRPGNTQNPICFPRPDALPRMAMFSK